MNPSFKKVVIADTFGEWATNGFDNVLFLILHGFSMLSPFEVSLLRSLEIGKEYSVEEASKTAKISKDAVLKAAYLLQDKGYAEVKEVLKKSYKLTKEGKEYLESGLPEERLFKVLKERGEVELSELEKEFGKKKYIEAVADNFTFSTVVVFSRSNLSSIGSHAV